MPAPAAQCLCECATYTGSRQSSFLVVGFWPFCTAACISGHLPQARRNYFLLDYSYTSLYCCNVQREEYPQYTYHKPHCRPTTCMQCHLVSKLGKIACIEQSDCNTKPIAAHVDGGSETRLPRMASWTDWRTLCNALSARQIHKHSLGRCCMTCNMPCPRPCQHADHPASDLRQASASVNNCVCCVCGLYENVAVLLTSLHVSAFLCFLDYWLDDLQQRR